MDLIIYRLDYISILRHVKVKTKPNPFKREDEKYFKQRYAELKVISEKVKQHCIILKKLTETDKRLLNL